MKYKLNKMEIEFTDENGEVYALRTDMSKLGIVNNSTQDMQALLMVALSGAAIYNEQKQKGIEDNNKEE